MIPSRDAAPPNTIPWPPLVLSGAAILAVALGHFVPLGDFGLKGTIWLGTTVMLAGLCLDVAAMVVMRRHKANILPHRAATALVISFPFSISRNPIYLGNTLMLGGAALVFGNPWFLAMAAAAAQAVTTLAIRREEAHLAAMFGTDWQSYAARVPRWLKLWP